MKFTRFTITFLAFFFLGSSLFAQTESIPKNEMNYGLGLNYGLFKDQNFSPLNYSNIGFAGTIGYARFGKNPNTLFSTSLALNYNVISTDVTDVFNSNLLQCDIRFSFLKKYYQKEDKLSIFIGPEFQSNNSMVLFDGASAFTYLFTHSLNAKAMATYKLNGNQSLKMGVSIPLVNWLVRPPHAGFNKTTAENVGKPISLITDEGKFASLNEYTAIDWNVEYVKKMNEKFSFTVGYGLNFQRIFADEKMIRLNNQLTLGLKKQF